MSLHKYLFIAVACGASTGALASSTNCTDPNSKLKYSAHQYDGGAAPPPNMVTITESGWLDGRPLGSNEWSQDGGWVRRFSADFDWQSRVDLNYVEDRPSNEARSTYAIKLKVVGPAGGGTFDDYVICRHVTWLIPPP